MALKLISNIIFHYFMENINALISPLSPSFMIIHIFGCPNSGKTTLRNKLKELHPELESWCIDDFRREYGDGTLPKELVAQDMYSR